MNSRSIRKAIHTNPGNTNLQYELGLAYHKEGNLAAAMVCFRKAIDLTPDHWEAHFRCGVILQNTNHFEETIFYYRKAIEIKPEFAEAYNNLGSINRRKGDEAAAMACFKKAVELAPDFIESWNNMANISREKKDYQKAIRYLEKILSLQPDKLEIHIVIGDVLKEAGRIRAAIKRYQKVADLCPTFSAAYFKLGLCHAEGRENEKAIECYKKAIECSPLAPEPYINLGNLYATLEQPEKAVVNYRKAIQCKPGFADPYFFLGCVLRELGDLQQSIIVTNKALEIDPSLEDARFSLALSYLLSGDYEKGWKLYDTRLTSKCHASKFTYLGQRPLWDGGPLAGKTILVKSEQGFGDTIQFARFMPDIKKRGGIVIFEVEKPLLGLLGDLPGVDYLRHNGQRALRPDDFDLYIPLLSVPGRLGLRLETIPAETPYLFAPEPKIKSWVDTFDAERFNVGVVWKGNPKHDRDKLRSFPLGALESLSRIPGILLYSLQKEMTVAERSLAKVQGISSLGERFHDFTDTAAAIHHLDLVITVDTSVAHLSAAMGKATWILLAKSPDFRWLTQSTDSPWYPTARLYRQKRRGDWAEVLASVGKDLEKLVFNGLRFLPCVTEKAPPPR